MIYNDTHQFPICIDYHHFQDYIEKNYGINHRDYAGRRSAEGKLEEDKKIGELLESLGFDSKEYSRVKNKPEGSIEDWPAMSPEMQHRVKCNIAIRDNGGWDQFARPYQDWWHQHCDDITRGAVNYISLSDYNYDEKKEDWICAINKLWREELKDHPAYDAGEETVSCFIDW